MLSNFMRFKGIVLRGKGRGKDLGFPTANVEGPEEIEDGLYVGYASITPPSVPPHQGEGRKPALIFVGAAETFGETKRNAEVYILDFSEDLYGQKIDVEILKKIRENKKFDSKEELIAQMNEDVKVARNYFETFINN
jgi:riboflavin kinase / FMN adenylyltransferase